jgi:hypothetical protein
MVHTSRARALPSFRREEKGIKLDRSVGLEAPFGREDIKRYESERWGVGIDLREKKSFDRMRERRSSPFIDVAMSARSLHPGYYVDV